MVAEPCSEVRILESDLGSFPLFHRAESQAEPSRMASAAVPGEAVLKTAAQPIELDRRETPWMADDRRPDVRIWSLTCGLTRLAVVGRKSLEAASCPADTGQQRLRGAACAQYVPKFSLRAGRPSARSVGPG
jgi:hypothetical protein